MAKLLRKLRISEVSSVNRGAGEGVQVMLMKKDEDSMADSDGPGPMRKVKQAIAALRKSVSSIVGADVEAEDLDETFKQFDDHVEKVLSDEDAQISKGDDDMTDDVKKQLDELTKTNADLVAKFNELAAENNLLKMSKDHQDYMSTLSGDAKSKFAAMSADERSACAAKKSLQAELPESVKKALAEGEEIRKVAEAQAARLAKLEAKDELASFAKKATEIGLPESMGEVLMKASRGDTEAFAKIEETVKGLVEQVRTGKVFAEFGHASPAAASAYDALVAKGQELQKADPKLSDAQAFTKAYEDPKNRELVIQSKREQLRIA